MNILENLLAEARSWQECLLVIEQNYLVNGKKINYAYIARKAGFASRSYVRMLFIGKKNPTLQSLEKLLNVIKISYNAKKYIILYWQFSQIVEDTQKSNQLLKQIEILKKKLIKTNYRKINDENYLNSDAPIVFAALGHVGVGVKINEIKLRTGLSESRILSAVEALIKNSSVVKQDDHIYPTDPQLVIEDSLKSGFFKNFYFELLKKAEIKATGEFFVKKNLFAGFAVSIDSSRQHEYSDRLYKILIEFLNEIESVDGDKVIKLNASMFD